MKTYRLTSHDESEIPLPAAKLDEISHQLPQGVYTTFRTYAHGARVLGLQLHLDRLYQPARAQGIQPEISEQELRRFLLRACSTLGNEARVRLTLSLTDSPGAVFATIQPFTPLGADVYQQGVRVISAETSRSSPRLKSTAFIESSAEMRKLVTGDVFEVLLRRDERVLEGMTSNFYAVQRGVLVTSRYGILLGVTRRTLIRLARKAGLEIEYRPPELDEPFEEAFLTSSSRGVVPIVAIDGKAVADGQPGQWTKKLMAAYNAYVEKNAELIFA